MAPVTKALGMSPKPAPAPVLPPAPPDNSAAIKAQEAAAEEERRKRAGAGSAANVLTGLGADGEDVASARRMLLG